MKRAGGEGDPGAGDAGGQGQGLGQAHEQGLGQPHVRERQAPGADAVGEPQQQRPDDEQGG